MISYDPKKHEMLALHWYLQLVNDEREFDNLFARDLHNLTGLLWWISHTVSCGFELDEEGIWAAAWVEPCIDGAYMGAWIRKSKRHTKQALKFINEAYTIALKRFPVLMGLTVQPQLHDLHMKLGYNFGCWLPGLFHGKDAILYVMTRQSRNERRDRRYRPPLPDPPNTVNAGQIRDDRHSGLVSDSGQAMASGDVPKRNLLRGQRTPENMDASDNSGREAPRPRQRGRTRQSKIQSTSRDKSRKLPKSENYPVAPAI